MVVYNFTLSGKLHHHGPCTHHTPPYTTKHHQTPPYTNDTIIKSYLTGNLKEGLSHSLGMMRVQTDALAGATSAAMLLECSVITRVRSTTAAISPSIFSRSSLANAPPPPPPPPPPPRCVKSCTSVAMLLIREHPVATRQLVKGPIPPIKYGFSIANHDFSVDMSGQP